MTTIFSCGPRTGIHNDKSDNPDITRGDKNFVCGNVLSEEASKGVKKFKLYCAVCHTSHSDEMLTGPGLYGVFDRVPSEDWFILYTLNSDSVNNSGDKYAKKLRKRFKDVRMTNFSGELTKADVTEIIAFLKSPH